MSAALGSYAIFADDVRAEANGKAIFIGVYRDAMFFGGEPPWLLPQFFVNVVYRVDAESISGPVKFEVRSYAQNGMTLLGVFDADFSQIKDITAQDPFRLPYEPPNLSRFAQASFALRLAPLILNGETRISVHAVSSNGEVVIDRIRALKLEKADAYNKTMLPASVQMTAPDTQAV